MSRTPIAPLLVVLGIAAVAKIMHEHSAAAAQSERDALVAEFDDLWLQALHLGADADRWPEIAFVAHLEDRQLAVTHCDPRPRIEVNRRLLARYRWYYHAIAVPHELAHVMVCLKGTPAEFWQDPHGDVWRGWVRALAPHETADVVLAEQEALTEPASTGGDAP